MVEKVVSESERITIIPCVKPFFFSFFFLVFSKLISSFYSVYVCMHCRPTPQSRGDHEFSVACCWGCCSLRPNNRAAAPREVKGAPFLAINSQSDGVFIFISLAERGVRGTLTRLAVTGAVLLVTGLFFLGHGGGLSGLETVLSFPDLPLQGFQFATLDHHLLFSRTTLVSMISCDWQVEYRKYKNPHTSGPRFATAA